MTILQAGATTSLCAVRTLFCLLETCAASYDTGNTASQNVYRVGYNWPTLGNKEQSHVSLHDASRAAQSSDVDRVRSHERCSRCANTAAGSSERPVDGGHHGIHVSERPTSLASPRSRQQHDYGQYHVPGRIASRRIR